MGKTEGKEGGRGHRPRRKVRERERGVILAFSRQFKIARHYILPFRVPLPHFNARFKLWGVVLL